MFLFFSNRLGCLGSLLVSVALTLALLVVLGVIDLWPLSGAAFPPRADWARGHHRAEHPDR